MARDDYRRRPGHLSRLLPLRTRGRRNLRRRGRAILRRVRPPQLFQWRDQRVSASPTTPHVPPDGHPSRYVYVTVPACPECESIELRTYRTNAPDERGCRSRYVRCRACGARFIVVSEPPTSDAA